MATDASTGLASAGRYVFASYSHQDAVLVEPEIAAVEQFVPIWYDDDIQPGHRWNDELASAIVGCAAFLLFVTPRSVASEHCRRELQFAIAEARTIIAIHLLPTEMPHGLRLALNDRQAILKYELSADRYRQRLEATFGAERGAGPARASTQSLVVSDRPSIAVLPFAVLTQDTETAAFAAVMTEDLTTLLSRVPDFFVVSRQSAANVAAVSKDPGAIALALRVRYLVTGSVRSAGDRLRVSAQLIDAGNGSTLWANTFDRRREDVFALQDELARRVAGQLHPELVIADLDYGRSTGNYNSWRRVSDAILKYGHSPAPQDIADLIVLIEENLAADPDYAPTQAQYAFALARQRNWGDLPEEQIQRAEKAAKRALELAPHDPLVLYFVAGVEQALGRRRNGERLALQAADREPSNAAFQATAGFILALGGKLEPGIERLTLAVELSPRDPLRGQYLFQLGAALFMSRRFGELTEVMDESLRLQPDNTWAWLLSAAASVNLGDAAATELAVHRLKTLSGWGAPQFRILLARVLADVWQETSDIRKLWEETLAALERTGL